MLKFQSTPFWKKVIVFPYTSITTLLVSHLADIILPLSMLDIKIPRETETRSNLLDMMTRWLYVWECLKVADEGNMVCFDSDFSWSNETAQEVSGT